MSEETYIDDCPHKEHIAAGNIVTDDEGRMLCGGCLKIHGWKTEELMLSDLEAMTGQPWSVHKP